MGSGLAWLLTVEKKLLAAEEGTAEVTCQLSGTRRGAAGQLCKHSHPGKNYCHPAEISAEFG